MIIIARLENMTFFLYGAVGDKNSAVKIKTLSHSHNSPVYCPCPLAPKNSACSVAVHCCGCRGPSVFRGPVEPLEEVVPEELWPPGEGKEGLLYGRHPSSKSKQAHRSPLTQTCDITATHLTYDALR